ncbi:unnamed protein product [Brassicogethes aeneus]|uniref:Cytochrome P450 n=1 Tax=Brassicogethes aeneus TaxID=1431903 RepID=A0A9P0B2Y6_BRAAE|nr:unnamed protein product [Brassicogethes aeneus]
MFVVLLIFVVTLLYVLYKRTFEYWKRRNVPGPEPTFLVGHIGESFLGKKSLGNCFFEIYKEYKDYPFVGVYKSVTPCLLVRDPEFLKCIYVKNFKSFMNNEMFVDKKVDPVMGRNPFFSKDQAWKETRALLTPNFTTGKMKTIFTLLDNVSQKAVSYVNKQIDSGVNCLEAKNLCTKITLENVASCAFGLEANCFNDPNCDFQDIANKFLSPEKWQSLKIFVSMIIPSLMKVLSIRFISKEVAERLRKIVFDTVDYREKNNVQRPDFLQSMMQLKDSTKDFDPEDMVAHAASFFGDGYETSSIVMSFLLYEIAKHPEVQDKLRQEINDTMDGNGGKLTYDVIMEMEYLDACLNGKISKNPFVESLSKRCTEKFSYKPANTSEFKDIDVTVDVGTVMVIPVKGLFLDPKYFDEPDKFIPARFLKENRKNDRSQGVFRPFGDGPRVCIGQKFGLLQIKAAVAHIIRAFSVSVNSKTKEPLEFDPWYLMLSPIGGLWLDFHKIK